VTQDTPTSVTNSANFQISGRAGANSLYAGIIGPCGIFNRELLATEIKQLFYFTKKYVPAPPQLPKIYTLISNYYVTPMDFVQTGTSNGKPKYVYDANKYIEWDGVSDWVIYLDDGGSIQSLSITDSSNIPPEAPANTWDADYIFSMTSLTLQ
jgi:hypothetical protein